MFEQSKVELIKESARKRLGKDIALLKTLETHPGVLIPYAEFSRALDKTNLVPTRLKALAQVRVAKLVECPF